MRTTQIPLLLAAVASLALGACNSPSKSSTGSSSRAATSPSDFTKHREPNDVLTAQQIAAQRPSCGSGSRCHYTDPRVSPVGDTGLHTAHLGDVAGETFPPGANRTTPLMANPACGNCHFVPGIPGGQETLLPEHIDGVDSPCRTTNPPTCFDGPDINFQLFAVAPPSTGVPAPVWNRSLQPNAAGVAGRGCANLYCHGSSLAGGLAGQPQKRAAWVWNPAAPAALCSDCHGAPPNTPSHQGMPALPAGQPATQCASCHSSTVDAQGAIIAAAHINGAVEATGCTGCHGTQGGNGAPPKGVLGELNTTDLVVGAHQVHTNANPIHAAYSCGDCHPPVVGGQHPSGGITPQTKVPAEVLATVGWTRSSATCTNACHGANLKPGDAGSASSPIWTKVDGTQATCGSCHGAPPTGSTHPSVTVTNGDMSVCAPCHSDTLNSNGTINVAGGKHIDGVIEAKGCNGCHGSAANNAPPAAVTARPTAVGAHQKHVVAPTGIMSKPVDCSICHPAIGSPHPEGLAAARVVFSGIAAQKAGAAYDFTAATCATYCHGLGLKPQNQKPAIVWTAVTAGATSCTLCHGSPPASHAATSTNCSNCHGQGYSQTTVVAATHIDGKLDVAGGSCNACHGGANAAPSSPTEVVTSSPYAVGAHQAHVNAGPLAAAIACYQCHPQPTSISEPTHIDGITEVTFPGYLARDGMAPAWNTTNGTCTNTYCHGPNSRALGTTSTPGWLAGSSAVATCNSCHQAPPPAPHPANPNCESCHPTGYSAVNRTVNVATHVNGTVDLANLTCTSCHGTAGVNEAPPIAATTRPSAIGAHQAHVQAGPLADAIGCEECHGPKPTSVGHANGTTDLPFGTLAHTANANPQYSMTALTCSSTYCHGATLQAGGTNQTPSWTGGASQAACGTCHGVPPPAPHPANTNCASCHGTGYALTGITGAAKTTHVDGKLDIGAMTCTSCHGTAGRAGPNTLSQAAPPVGTQGQTAITSLAVGAHQPHIQTNKIASPLPCTACHVVPTSTLHATGTVDMSFTGLGSTGGVKPAWNRATATCTNYCHGANLSGGSRTTPVWTSSTPTSYASCSSCHGVPPGTGKHSRHDRMSCDNCHGSGYSSSAVNVATHVNGVKNVGGTGSRIRSWNATTQTCQPSCHGSESWGGSSSGGSWGGR